MQLNWNWDPVRKMATAFVTNDLQYKTPDGGQTIQKFFNGELVKTFHKYGPDKKFTEVAKTGHHTDVTDGEWEQEIIWLSENYEKQVGTFIPSSEEGYRTKTGELVDAGKSRGFGINNHNDKFSVNRMLAPANITEWWDWDEIAASDENPSPDCQGRGLVWRRNYKTGEVCRTSTGNPPMPCCVFPTIYGPFYIEPNELEKDLEKYKGKFV